MIAFISDIHGNYPALQAVLDMIDQLSCEQIYCLGDVVGYYCQINECIELLLSRNVCCLLGNHDFYLISNTCCSSKTVKICLDYQKRIILPEFISWLAEKQPILDTSLFSLRHGGWHDAVEERFSEFDFSLTADMECKYYLSGHTHIQSLQKDPFSEKVYCNPGSVGQPRDNDPRAAFATLDNHGEFVLHRTPYDIDATVFYMKKQGLGEWIWQGLYTGKQIGAK